MKAITPVVVGRGMAGSAILKSLKIVLQADSELELLPVRQAQRNRPLSDYIDGDSEHVLFLANPSGLHAASILEGVAAGYGAIAAEKPACVLPEEIESLKSVEKFVSVYHVYRAMWGIQTIKGMIEAGELGEVFSFESRYWQSSSAQKALEVTRKIDSWKNDPGLNGPADALTDIGSHAADICLFLLADVPVRCRCRLSYRNSEAPHRDTHVHVSMDFSGDRQAILSISKTMHGSGNDLECTVAGTKGAATWRFVRPDEVEFGSGNRRTIIPRVLNCASSGSRPFHGLGWLEGYVTITHQTLRRAAGLNPLPVPTLSEALDVMRVLLCADRDG